MMTPGIRFLLTSALWICGLFAYGQSSNLRVKEIDGTQDTLQLDTLSIYPNSFELYCGDERMEFGDFRLNYAKSELILVKKCSDQLRVRYRVLPMDLSKTYQVRDTSRIYNREKGERENFLISTSSQTQDVFGGTSLKKSGSISRGISFGNNQDLGVNSSLNLELTGDLGPNLKLLASISDDNIPIQPEGNTNKLQEFDQVFIQIYNDRLKLIAGDFWISKPTGYFMSYKKRAQGLTIEYAFNTDSSRVWKTQASGALSKGKFQRQIIQGVEGNQGPYRLRGVENEPFIIILAGTERVYIDGKMLERGQEFDYVINYNTSEIIFTSRNQITKDSRIVIEFQYSDQNYARSLLQSSTSLHTKKFDFWLNGYSEQDAKNQTLQQDLSPAQRQLLATIGDTLSLARTSSIDSVGFIENQLLYGIKDSLGYDSVLVYTVNPDSAYVRATFQYVGPNKGNYVFEQYIALGKVYKWVAPVGGIPQGDYEASRLIITPKQRQMVSSGFRYRFNKSLSVETELAYTKNDINTFSRYDSFDDNSFAGRTRFNGNIPLSKDSIPKWNLNTKVELEVLDRYFSPIEQYRAVEFDRDWNTRNKGYTGNQVATTVGADFRNRSYGNFNIEGQQYMIGNDYQGIRAALDGKWKQKGFDANWVGSYLSSDAVQKNEFLRHKVNLSQDFRWIKIGYKDDHERNTFRTDSSGLTTGSYQFFDYQFYIANGDSIKNFYSVFYRERYDWISDGSRLSSAAKAQTAGGEVKVTELKNQTINVLTSYRELKITDPSLINQTPENSLLGRIDYELRLFKNAFTWNTFYEIGSGLEQKREFVYLQVNTGQGIYTWIDYNNDGVKDLNEFEIAQYVDQASYIRVFTPSDDYIKTYSNEYNQSLYWRPERIWASREGALKLLSRFSNQTRVRISRKTNLFNGVDAFNPFAGNIRDTNLISTAHNFRNTLYFNRTSNIAGADWSFQDGQTKTLLASGFDSRSNRFNELKVRWNIAKKFTLESEGQVGNKASVADYTSGRNYFIDYHYVKPSFSYQPTTAFRVSLIGRYEEKHNREEFGGESAYIGEIGTNLKFNQAEKGSLQAEFKLVNISYGGNPNSALGFEMLEALKPGVNYTWNLGYQRLISKNLQLSIQYNGRKSEQNKTIHSAGMEVRAFF